MDQTWNATQPMCVKCTDLADPYGGNVLVTTDDYVSTASYTCPSEYYLVGTSTRTCSSSGSWSSTDPSCECSDPLTPTNGHVTANGMLATYTCDLNYTLIGSPSRTCLSNGAGWSDSDPVCTQCSSLARPTGGSYQISTTGTITSASFTCEAGYTISGSTSITCQSDGSWETPPTCAECTTLPGIDSGSILQSTNGYVTVANYTCATGYDRQGSATRSCNTDGSWTLSAPTCTCQSPSVPLNGGLSANGVTATYQCDVGYTLSGSRIRTCANDGSGWSGSDPMCSTCNELEAPTNGHVSLSTNNTQTIATFNCNAGYTLSGSKTISCDTDGLWNTVEPQCSACPTLSNPSSGSVSVETDGSITTASFTCSSGYYISGAQSFTCGTDGQWTDTAPTCKCITPATPANGEVSVSDGNNGQEADYKCNVEYSLSGSASRLCQTNGQGWTSTDPVCVPCTTLADVTGGSIRLNSDGQQTHAIITCDVGYTINGVRNMTCGSDGAWDFTEPTCVKCPNLADPSSGSVTLATDNYITRASFSCVSGYYVSGAQSVTCGVDGEWSDTSPTCKCNIPAAPANGSVSVSDGTMGPEAYYQCELGYSLSGTATRLCQSNGQGWDSSDPTCGHCQSITTQQNTMYSLSTNGTTTSVTYSCPVNFTLDGVDVHICNGAGTWNNPTPTCEQCSIIHSPLSGSVAISTDGLSTKATFSCVSGYSLNSTAVSTCQADGTWNFPEPACVCDPPSAVTNGEISLSSNGRIANYNCSTGYKLVGLSQRYCIDDGTGWNGTAPRCDAIAAAAASTDEKDELSIPLAVFIVMLIIILGMIVGIGLFLYCRAKIDRSKISTTFEGSEGSQPIEERTSDLNSPNDIENGRTALIGKQGETKLVFNVRKLNPVAKSEKKTDVNSSAPNGIAKHLDVNDSLTEVEDSTPVISMPNGSPQNVPIQSVRLPKLPPRPPLDHKQKSKKTHVKRKRKPQTPKETKPEPRSSTPLEIQMRRTQTPEILSSAEFGYISPQFCYEADSPIPSRPSTTVSKLSGVSRPSTSFSGKSIRTDSGVNIDLNTSKASNDIQS